jgi:hypothetical protein
MDAIRFDNSASFTSLVPGAVLALLGFVITEIWIFSDYPDPTARAAGILIGVAFGIVAFYFVGLQINYLNRPKSVEMSDEGVKLNMRLGKRHVIIDWPDVLMIAIRTSIMGKDIGEIRNDIRWYYPIDYAIAVKLREGYLQRMGKYPPKTPDELCSGMQRDQLTMSSSQFAKKYERFKKK